jgi:hypothetical protein
MKLRHFSKALLHLYDKEISSKQKQNQLLMCIKVEYKIKKYNGFSVK